MQGTNRSGEGGGRKASEYYVTPDLSYDYYGGTISKRTYGTHENQYVSLFLLTICVPIYYEYVPRNRKGRETKGRENK